MKPMKVVISGSLLALAFSTGFAAGNSAGQAAAYLKLGVDARILGMGGAGSTVSRDVNATYWNPAGLANITGREIAAMHTSLSLDRNYNSFSYAAPVGERGWVLGAAYHRFSIDGIPETRVHSFDVDGNGRLDDPILVGDTLAGNTVVNASDPGRTVAPVQIFSYFEDAESFISFSAAKQICDKLYFGGTTRFLRQELFNADADGYGIDFGLHYDFSERAQFGFSMRNMYSSLDWSTGRRDEVPMTTTIGGAVKLKSGIRLAADVVKRESEKADVRIGAEKWFKDKYGLRLGNNEGDFTVGASAKLNEWSFDYAYNDQDLGSVQRISLKRSF